MERTLLAIQGKERNGHSADGGRQAKQAWACRCKDCPDATAARTTFASHSVCHGCKHSKGAAMNPTRGNHTLAPSAIYRLHPQLAPLRLAPRRRRVPRGARPGAPLGGS